MDKTHAEIAMTWANMMVRCYDVNSRAYRDYGGRGLTVCERWHDFRNFCEDMAPRPEDMSLDRIDNDRGYSPDNVRWATKQQQAANRRNNVNITIDGETKGVAEWSRLSGVGPDTIIYRIKHDWEPRAAVFGTMGDGPQFRKLTHNGRRLSITDWANETGLTADAIRQRLGNGWTVERTLTEGTFPNRIPLTFNGETHSIAEWSKRTSVPQNLIRSRLDRGWSIDRALTHPVTKSRKYHKITLAFNGETLSIRQWAAKTGIAEAHIRNRLALGWTVDQVFTTEVQPRHRSLEFENQNLTIEEWSRKTGIAPGNIRNRLHLGWTIERTLTEPVKSSRKNESA